MERGVYFDGWSPQTYCQHPSMPPRRISMIDDLEEMGATALVWAGLGGGSISLPYLEEEAYGEVSARFRHYGYVNEQEFIQHTRDRGIDLFGIVFESQAWEFPAEVVDGVVVAQNEVRGVAPRSTIGMREFSTDTGPGSWKPWRHYFPDGLRNSDGEDVVDVWEEVACRDLDGEPIRAHWVEVAVRDQVSYYADRNNPVWREYLKAIVRIQIDAGAPGVQLDETDTPMSALRYGGCFCKDCVKEFRSYLQSLDSADLPSELDGLDLATFDYAQWLRDRGHRARENPRGLPLYHHFTRSLQIAIARTFREIASYAKEYAASVGREVRVGGNFYDLAAYWDPMVDDVDVLVTEMRETRFQQPWYFRHGVGMSRGRPLIAVENPYGGVVPLLLDRLQKGRARDLFRLTIFEASAMGANMSLPYGSWLGTEIKDSYWVPRDLVVETGQFLQRIDPLISPRSPHRTAVVYSVASIIDSVIDSDQFNDADRWFPEMEVADAKPESYWSTVEALSRATRTFDVVVFPDPVLRADDPVAQDLRRYDTIVLPDAWAVSEAQHADILAALDRGASVLVVGAYGERLGEGEAARVLEHAGTTAVTAAVDAVAHVPVEVEAELGELAAVSLHEVETGLALHVVNYDYDQDSDAVRVRENVDFGVRSDRRFAAEVVVSAPGVDDVTVPLTETDGMWRVTVPQVGPYVVVHLREESSSDD